MVDFQSRYRLYGLGYLTPEIREPVSNKRLHAHEVSRHVHRHYGDRRVHDCRDEIVKKDMETDDWETQLLAEGLNQSYLNTELLHTPRKEPPSKRKKGDKKLFQTGTFGSELWCFNYPRGITTSFDTSDILIADSQNNCIKVFNQCGVFKFVFGSKGNDPGQFNEPTGVCELPNGDLAIADMRNKRVQIFTADGKFKSMFPTVHVPYGIACNSEFNIVVSTISRKIEVYEETGKLLHNFSITGKPSENSPIQICANKNEVIVCDPDDCFIKYYTLGGRFLHQFQPGSPGIGQAIVPSGICLNPIQQVLVADSLNHTVNLYTDRGVFIEQLISPTDDVGTIHAINVGPEGHLVTTEFSVSGEHCVKIFKYRECKCHTMRPLSSKRTTPRDFSLV